MEAISIQLFIATHAILEMVWTIQHTMLSMRMWTFQGDDVSINLTLTLVLKRRIDISNIKILGPPEKSGRAADPGFRSIDWPAKLDGMVLALLSAPENWIGSVV